MRLFQKRGKRSLQPSTINCNATTTRETTQETCAFVGGTWDGSKWKKDKYWCDACFSTTCGNVPGPVWYIYYFYIRQNVYVCYVYVCVCVCILVLCFCSPFVFTSQFPQIDHPPPTTATADCVALTAEGSDGTTAAPVSTGSGSSLVIVFTVIYIITGNGG